MNLINYALKGFALIGITFTSVVVMTFFSRFNRSIGLTSPFYLSNTIIKYFGSCFTSFTAAEYLGWYMPYDVDLILEDFA
jgi:hypothetical protein